MKYPLREVKVIGARFYLRVFWDGQCPLVPGTYSYHNTHGPTVRTTDHPVKGYVTHTRDALWEEDGVTLDMWPTKCGCGAERPEEASFQIFRDDIWNTPDGNLHPGDYWWGEHIVCEWTNCDGKHLFVILPGKDGDSPYPWDAMSRASNCGSPNDKTHRCWVVDPKAMNVSKNGHTCRAGAGSIINGHWHGFLRNGTLIPA